MKTAPGGGPARGDAKYATFLWVIGAMLLPACGAVPSGPDAGSRTGTDAASARDASGSADDSVADGSTPDASNPVPDASAVDAPESRDATIPCGAPEYRCPSGYRCIGLSTTQCVPTAAVGEPCHESSGDRIYCTYSATCERVLGVERCVAFGTENGVCRNTDGCAPVCEPGLGCDPSTHCRPGLTLGELCGGAGDFCNDGSSCQDVNGTRRCIADGASGGYCRVGRLCEAGLFCSGYNSGSAVGCNREYFHCLPGLPLGYPCEAAGAPCLAGTTCALSRGAMRCVAHADGTPGGRCRETSPACDSGTVCDDRGWTCVRSVARGMPCDPTGGSTACADGDTCSAEHLADGGRCVAPGTAPGANCRATEPRCDGELRCSDFSRYRRTCRTIARAGDPCDLGGIQTLCPSPTRCVPATGVSLGTPIATCTTAIPETEPNDRTVTTRTPLTQSALFAASLSAVDVEDCHAVRMPSGSLLWVESTAMLVVRLFRSSGLEIGRWTLRSDSHGPLSGSARLDPAAIGVLRDLAADDYLLCVRPQSEFTSPTFDYKLAIGVLPAPR